MPDLKPRLFRFCLDEIKRQYDNDRHSKHIEESVENWDNFLPIKSIFSLSYKIIDKLKG
jgi:hypothetical protein